MFWLYFAPFIIVFVAIIVMDLLSSGFYIYDYFATLSVNGLIRILEIRNPDEVRPLFERIAVSTRSLPAMIMFCTVSKAVFILIFNIFLVFAFSPAAWQVCAKNEDIVKVLRKMELHKRSSSKSTSPKSKRPRPKSPTIPTVSKRTHQINLTVTPVQEVENDSIENQPKDDQQPPLEQQPPFNPYPYKCVTNQPNQQTYF